jgi:hypothetical protein
MTCLFLKYSFNCTGKSEFSWYKLGRKFCFDNLAKVRYHFSTICNHVEFYNSNPYDLKYFIHFKGNCDFPHEH